MAKKVVSASVVRAWAVENKKLISKEGKKCLTATARGRLHPDVIKAFNSAHSNMTHKVGTLKESKIISVKVPTVTNGRKVHKTIKMTAKEVSALTGHTGRGRIPDAVKLQAAMAKI